MNPRVQSIRDALRKLGSKPTEGLVLKFKRGRTLFSSLEWQQKHLESLDWHYNLGMSYGDMSRSGGATVKAYEKRVAKGMAFVAMETDLKRAEVRVHIKQALEELNEA